MGNAEYMGRTGSPLLEITAQNHLTFQIDFECHESNLNFGVLKFFTFVFIMLKVTDNIPNQTRRRRRCRSWNANPTIPVEADDINGQNVENSVFGESVICLSRDGFQLIGNLICKTTGRVFKLHGLRTDETLESIPEISDVISASPSRLLELRSSGSTGRSTPSESSDGSSCPDNDQVDLGSALLDLVLDDSDDLSEINTNGGEKLLSSFSICLNDMDTGLNFEVSDAKCVQIRQSGQKKSSDDSCRLISSDEKFKFFSNKRLHGDKAELLISKQFGPKYCGMKFVVFRGEMAFSYQYPMCYPKNNVNETKWCL